MSRHTRRQAIVAGAALLGMNSSVKGGEPPLRQIAASSIPKEVQIVGVLGKPLCTLVKFKGIWSMAYDHRIKGDSLHLKIDTVDDAASKEVVFPDRLVEVLRQTTGLYTEEVLQEVREGDVWTGEGFETAEIGWVPDAVFRLPGVVPWRDGRPVGAVSRLACVRLNVK